MKRQMKRQSLRLSPNVDEIVRMTLTAFAVYRLAYLIASEEGPGLPIGDRANWGMGLAARLRGKIDPRQSTYIGRGLRCVFCVSFWIAMVAAFFLSVNSVNSSVNSVNWLVNWLVNWFALAGMVLFIHRLGN